MPQMTMIQTNFVGYVLPILIFFTIAYFIYRFSGMLARRIKPLKRNVGPDTSRRQERMRTIQVLIANAISVIAFIVATLASLALFFSADTLLWVVGLFSAAFGLGARPFISDYLTGLSFIFEDTFFVGDKIEIPLQPQRVEGIVEKVSLRVTEIRGMDGEVFTMPNGDIRLVRNFSRGDHSPTRITLKIAPDDLVKTLNHLEEMSTRAMSLLPNLIEPWQVISETGELGEETELTVLAKAKFGKGAEMRIRMLALIQKELTELKVSSKSIQPDQEVEAAEA